MDDWALLESVEGLDEELSEAGPGALWEFLQGEKEEICREICARGALAHGNGFAANERDPSDEYNEELEWRQRHQLEHRLREVIDAQDRLIEGTYGRCAECQEQIEAKRLLANPTADLCISCQRSCEPELAFHKI